MLRARAWLVALLAAAAIGPACGGLSRFERQRDAGATSGADDDTVTPPPDAGRAGAGGAGRPPSDAGGGARPPDAASDAEPLDAAPPPDAASDAEPPDAEPPDAAFDGGASSDFVSLVAGGDHSCALSPDGKIWCWGRNDNGQLGDGTTLEPWIPSEVRELPAAVSVGAYDRFSCAVVEDGTVRCWGSTDQQRLGSEPADPDPPWLTQPVTVPGVTGATSLSQGSTAGHACALTASWLYCWGSNEFAQLAQGSMSPSAAAAPSVGGCCPISAAGSYQDGCIANELGYVGCSGGSPGNGQQRDTSVFTTVSLIDDARAVATGADFGCVLRMNGTVACWGANSDGELGNGTDEQSVEPVAVDGLQGVTKLALGAHHACALLDSGKVSCWGKNLHGQLGNGRNEQANRPVAALDLDDVIDIGAGNEHTCALGASGVAWCWGSNLYRQLGASTAVERAWPEIVTRVAP